MNKFKTLFKMQLKEKLDLSFLKSKKQTLFKVVFSILIFVAITALAYFILWFCKFLNLFSALNHIPLSFMSFVYFVIFVLNICTCTLGLSKTLYYSNDNQVLVTYPVNSNSLFLSKMLVYYISEIKKCFTFTIPIFYAYGLLSSFSFMYYIWFLVMSVMLASIPVLIGGILSIPTYYIMLFLKRFPIIKIILVILVLIGLVAGVVYLIRLIPEDINLIKNWSFVARRVRDFLSSFNSIFYPFYAVIIFLCGNYQNFQTKLFTSYSYIVLLCALAIILLLIFLNYITSRPLYLKMITKQFEFYKSEPKVKSHNIKRDTIFSTCIYEARKCYRDTNLLSSSVATMIITPIAVLLLNSIYAAINTRLIGDYLTICFNVLIILILVLSHNINVSSIYSRDGEALYLNKTKPNSPIVILLPRLFYNFVVALITLTISSSIFFVNTNLGVGSCLLLFFAMLFVTCSHMVWSAEIDFLKPNSNVYKTDGIAGINPNELKSTFLAFIMSGLTFGIILFFLMDGLNYVWLKVFLIALVLLLFRIYLFYVKSRTLFREM